MPHTSMYITESANLPTLYLSMSPPALEVKKTRKRPLTIDSASDELDSPVKSPRAKRTKWNHEDNQKINQYSKRYVTPNGKNIAQLQTKLNNSYQNIHVKKF